MSAGSGAKQLASQLVTDWLVNEYDCGCGALSAEALAALEARVVSAIGTVLGGRIAAGGHKRSTAVKQPHPKHCTKPGCKEPHSARGMCRTHHREWFKTDRLADWQADRESTPSSADVPADLLKATRCSVPLCSDGPRSRGMCFPHYDAWRRSTPAEERGRFGQHGQTAAPPPGDPKPMMVRVDESTVEEHRNTTCPAYNACLSWCTARGWPGFSCKGCKGPAADVASAFASQESAAADADGGGRL